MALKRFERRRAPIDGSTFRTMANLDSLLRAAESSGFRDDMEWPVLCVGTWVPVWVRMVPYMAQITKQNPTGMVFGPHVRIGSPDSTEFELNGRTYAVGLTRDHNLDFDDPNHSRLIYTPETFTPQARMSAFTHATSARSPSTGTSWADARTCPPRSSTEGLSAAIAKSPGS